MSEVGDQTQDNELSEQIDENKEPQVVKHDTFQRLLRQKKATDERLKELEAMLAEKKQKEELEQLERQKEQEKWKEVSATLEQKLKEKEQSENEWKSRLLDSAKLQAVVERLPKFKKKEYLSFVPLDKIEIDHESGTIDESSVEEVANFMLSEYKNDLFVSTNNSKLPDDAATGGKTLTLEQWKALPLKEKKARQAEVFARYKDKL